MSIPTPRKYRDLLALAREGNALSQAVIDAKKSVAPPLRDLSADLTEVVVRDLPFMAELVAAKFAEVLPNTPVEVVTKRHYRSGTSRYYLLEERQIGSYPGFFVIRALLVEDKIVVYLRKGEIRTKGKKPIHES